jgi:hypothetical protein
MSIYHLLQQTCNLKRCTLQICPILLLTVLLFSSCQRKCPPPPSDAARTQVVSDSVYDHYQMRTTAIATPKGVVALFGKAGFAAPDSVREQCYLQRQAEGGDRRICLDQLQFLDLYVGVDDTTDQMPYNRKTFLSFQKRFPSGYGGVKGIVNFFSGEIVFEFGEGQWVHKERYIVTCDEVVRISEQGHAMTETVIEYDGKRVDSVGCEVRYY